MSERLLEEFTRQYVEAQSVPEVTFAWQGGEPTLIGLDFFRHALELQNKYRRPGLRVYNALQTNATLLDDEWCAFFREHDFLVGVSLDGPRELHDAYRVDKGGASTFGRVMRGIQLLNQHQVAFNVLTAVHSANADQPLPVYRFLRDEIGCPGYKPHPFRAVTPVERRLQSCGSYGSLLGVQPRAHPLSFAYPIDRPSHFFPRTSLPASHPTLPLFGCAQRLEKPGAQVITGDDLYETLDVGVAQSRGAEHIEIRRGARIGRARYSDREISNAPLAGTEVRLGEILSDLVGQLWTLGRSTEGRDVTGRSVNASVVHRDDKVDALFDQVALSGSRIGWPIRA